MARFDLPPRRQKPPPFDFPDGFAGGMNISVSPDQIAINQTPDVLNMTLDGGVWTKRYGFERLNTWGDTPIQGMHLFHRVGQPTEFLFAQGGHLWKLNEDNTRTLCGDKAFADRVTSFFTLNNRVYIMNGEDYLFYDGTHLEDVQGYVPLLTLGGSHEAPGTINEPLNYLSDSWWDSYSPDGEATEFPLTFQTLTDEPVVVEEDTTEGTVTYTEGVEFTVDRTAGKVAFDTAPAQGTNTLRIKGTKAGMMDKGLVLNCTISIIYGGKNDTRVFVAGNPDSPNLRLSSGVTDGLPNPEYFPEEAWEILGSDEEAITGFGRVADVLFTYKERSRYYTYIEGPNELGFMEFPIYPVNDEHGCIASRTVQPVQDGLLALSEEGVTWSVPSTVRGQFNTKIISRNINGRTGLLNENAQRVKGLLDNSIEDLKKAHAYVFNNKYWLHAGKEVWVLDLSYTDINAGVYCWYKFNNVPGISNCLLEYKERLYIGSNKEGSIYRGRGEYDREDFKYKEDCIENDIPDTFIDAYWTSPVLYVGGREWVKKFERLFMTFMPSEVPTDVILTLITEDGDELIILPQESTYFNYAYAYYDRFSYGVETALPATQSEKIGFKGEYIQWRVRSGWNNPEVNFSYDDFRYDLFCYDNPFFEGLRVAAQMMTFSLRKRIK